MKVITMRCFGVADKAEAEVHLEVDGVSVIWRVVESGWGLRHPVWVGSDPDPTFVEVCGISEAGAKICRRVGGSAEMWDILATSIAASRMDRREVARELRASYDRGWADASASANKSFAQRSRKLRRGPWFVYLAHRPGALKIGFSANVNARIRALSTASDYPITLLAKRRHRTEELARAAELEAHRAFQEHRLAGEWFSDTPEIRRYFGINE